MIFDEPKQPSDGVRGDGASRRRRRRSRASSTVDSGRRRRSSSSFRKASQLGEPLRAPRDRNTSAWLWVLGLLILAALGFGAYLHHQRSAPMELPGEAPTSLLLPFVDPILAPLQTGDSGCSVETLSALQSRFRTEGAKLNADDRDVYASAGVIAQILGEALQDRTRHLERSANIGSQMEGMNSEGGTPSGLSETQRKHMELAVDVSWQRNSGAYRNRIEELWMRLQRLEQGRFRLGSAPPSMMPELPAANE